MKKLNQESVPWVENRSPKGRFHIFARHLSLALGGVKDAGPSAGGHPFDLALIRLPAGATNWPYHLHAAQWELYVGLTGQGEIRIDGDAAPFGAGDCVLCAPGEAHQITNSSQADLVYYVIADQPPADYAIYPDSNKWTAKPARKTFRVEEVDYYSGEE